jgi:hypothetical protein
MPRLHDTRPGPTSRRTDPSVPKVPSLMTLRRSSPPPYEARRRRLVLLRRPTRRGGGAWSFSVARRGEEEAPGPRIFPPGWDGRSRMLRHQIIPRRLLASCGSTRRCPTTSAGFHKFVNGWGESRAGLSSALRPTRLPPRLRYTLSQHAQRVHARSLSASWSRAWWLTCVLAHARTSSRRRHRPGRRTPRFGESPHALPLQSTANFGDAALGRHCL